MLEKVMILLLLGRWRVMVPSAFLLPVKKPSECVATSSGVMAGIVEAKATATKSNRVGTEANMVGLQVRTIWSS